MAHTSPERLYAPMTEPITVATWLEAYDQIINDFLPTDVLHRMQALFAKHFNKYEDNSYRKLNPNNCRDGWISCTAATLIVGRWWELKIDQQAWYIIDLENKPRQQHSLAYLPRTKRNEESIRQELERYRHENVSLRYLTRVGCDRDVLADYSFLGGSVTLQPPANRIPEHMLVHSNAADFLKDRMRVFGNLY